MKLDLARKRPSLLARLWLRLGALLGRTLLLLLVIGLLGWALSSAWFAWHHRGPVAVQEQVPADEAARTQDIIQTAVRIVDQHREGTRYLRDAHAKAHGCVKAQVQVLNDLSPPLRQGVFATPGQTWQAVVRLSNGNAYPQFDSIRDARGMAIKLLDVPGQQLMASESQRREQDFVMFNHPNFFVSDVAEYQQNIAAQATARKSAHSSLGGIRAPGRYGICSSPWRPCHRPRPARPRPPTTRSRPTSSAMPTPNSGSCRTPRVARPTACQHRTRICPTSCAAP